MSVLWLRARCVCDACGKPFETEVMDLSAKVSGSAFEVVEEALRGGFQVDGGSCSFQEGRTLCAACTSFEDAVWVKSHPRHISQLKVAPYEGELRLVGLLHNGSAVVFPLVGPLPQLDTPASLYGGRP